MNPPTIEILRHAIVVSSMTSALVLGHAIAAAPSKDASPLGIRGLRRRRALDDNELWRELEPLIRWLGVRVGGLLPKRTHESLDRLLTVAGDWLGLQPSELVALMVAGSLAGTAFGVALAHTTGLGSLILFAASAIGTVLPYIKLSEVAQRRKGDVNRRLPYAIDVLALAMSAGLDFPGAVRQLVEKSSVREDPVVDELTIVLHELGLGKTRAHALAELARRVPAESAIELAGTVTHAEEHGNPVADVIRTQALVSRQRRTVEVEEAAAKAAEKLLAPLVLLFFAIFILMLGPLFIKLAGTRL